MSLERATERAVIGALLLQPQQHEELREWLRADDFHGTGEGWAYRAIESLAQRRDTITPAAVDREIRARQPLAPGLADGPFVISCMQECPDPSRAAVYGRMVLELSIRRAVADQAADLGRTASKANSAHELTLVFGAVDRVRRDVERLHQREAAAAHALSPAPELAGELSPLARGPRRDDVVAERDAVMALVDQPAALARVTRWLTATDFGDRECAGLYAELTILHDARNPIDPVTLAWRAEKVGLGGPTCESLVARPDPTDSIPDPILAARRVLEQSVRAAVVATAAEVESMTRNGRGNATSHSHARLNTLWPQQRRLVRSRLG